MPLPREAAQSGVRVDERASGIDRISPGDLTVLATDVGPVPMNVGAALVLDPQDMPVDVGSVRSVLADRIAAIPRLRQRLLRVPAGLGRPAWVDASFDPFAHISVRPCPPPGDDQALLDLATAAVLEGLPRSRPLWRAVLVPELHDGRLGLVLVLHHVLADGIGGLAVLGALADPGWPGSPTRSHPVPRPSELAADRVASVGPALRRIPGTLARLRRAGTELGATRRPRVAPRTSLNAATGAHRHVAAVDVALTPVRAAARRHAATVNDVLLVATTAALGQVLTERGEHVPGLVVSVPIAARAEASQLQLGNQVGVVPILVGLTGPLPQRLSRVRSDSAAQVAGAADRGASADLVGPVFRALAALGLFRAMVNRQRLVNTFLTNLKGPAEPLTFAGAPIRRIIPITTTAGNVTCSFAALSYAGTLTVSVVTDPDRVPEHDRLAQALEESLRTLVEQL